MQINEYSWEWLQDEVAKYLFIFAWIDVVEEAQDEESELYDPDIFEVYDPKGGKWEDVVPTDTIPKSAVRQAKKIVREFKKQTKNHPQWIEVLEDLGDEKSGFLLVADSLGHGTGLWEYDIKFDYLTELDSDIHDEARNMMLSGLDMFLNDYDD